jgi:hypothetical protein
MDFKFPKKNLHAKDLIRRCGYGEWRGKDGPSYTRRLSSGSYPRFHVYLKDFETSFEVSLHIDQKQVSYEGSSAHSGEYDGPLVEDEARRITAVIAEIYGM